ncbi:MAG: hypothetical protein AB1429_15660 [Pseudomonadota bacterium]|jgi:hypothetical protein
MAIPAPEPGLVVHFNYLWAREHEEGREEARYPRPCAVILSYRRAADGSLIVMLAPITHSTPRDGDAAIEIPLKVKQHLGLDEARSWVVVDEVNETGWPGYDLQPNAQGEYAYGFIPPKLFDRIKGEMIKSLQAHGLKRVPR